MRHRRSATLRDLHQAVQCLPRATRIAMLEGIRSNPIIAGAYSDAGGICPMLAAHRAGGRTSFIAFARAWDGFAFRGSRSRRARRASERELLVLRTHLEASLLDDEQGAAELAAAVAEHRDLVTRRRSQGQAQTPRAGDSDRSRELRHRVGWRWMRVVRSLDEYERVLAALEDERAADREPALAPAE